MGFINLLLQLCFFSISVSAFYPYYPEYKCIQDGTCADLSNREASTNIPEAGSAGSGTFTVSIEQRIPADDLSHEVRVARYGERLSHKSASRIGPQDQSRSSVGKRANSFHNIQSTTPTMPNSAAIDQDGTDFSYVATVYLGSKKKPLRMLMDSGAISTWVMGSSCTSSGCKIHDSFGKGDSSTYEDSTDSFEIKYGTGSVAGNWVQDAVVFAGLNVPFTFGVAETISSEFNNYPMDGILGLGQGKKDGHSSFAQTLKDSSLLTANIFGVNLHRGSDNINNGEITFGAVDKSKFTGPITYTDTVNPGAEWIIQLGDAGFNGKGSGLGGKDVCIDTGTSYCFMPPDDAKLFYAGVPGAVVSADGNTYSVPCTTTISAQFTFSGVTYNVPPKDWVGGKSSDSDKMCTSNIFPRDATSVGNWLLGDTFLKSVYTVFDMDKSRIGFAVKPANAASTTSAASPTTTDGAHASFSSPTTLSSDDVSTSSVQTSSPPMATSDNHSGVTRASQTSTSTSSTVATPKSSSNTISPTDTHSVSETPTVTGSATGTPEGFNGYVAASSGVATAVPSPGTSAGGSPAPAATTEASSASPPFSIRTALFVGTFIAAAAVAI